MKKNLLLLIALITCFHSCKISYPEPTGITFQVKMQEKLSTGEIFPRSVKSVIHIWDASDKSLQFKSNPDAMLGFIYDNTNKSSVQAIRTDLMANVFYELSPGKYFAYVMMDNFNKKGHLAYSYTDFEIVPNDSLVLKKNFSIDVGAGKYEEWGKNQ